MLTKKSAERDSLELSHHLSLVIQNAEDAQVYLGRSKISLISARAPVLNKVREESATGFAARCTLYRTRAKNSLLNDRTFSSLSLLAQLIPRGFSKIASFRRERKRNLNDVHWWEVFWRTSISVEMKYICTLPFISIRTTLTDIREQHLNVMKIHELMMN